MRGAVLDIPGELYKFWSEVYHARGRRASRTILRFLAFAPTSCDLIDHGIEAQGSVCVAGPALMRGERTGSDYILQG